MMKLVYVFVERHNVLESIGVSFSNDEQIYYENNKLSIKSLESDFEYYEGIKSSAIVGKNGTGKSTLLDFIESCYGETDSSGFFVWQNVKESSFHLCPINFDVDSIDVESEYTVKVNNNYRNFLNYNKVRLVKSNNLFSGESNSISKKVRKNVFSHDLSLAKYKSGSPTKVAQRISRLMKFFSHSSWMANEKNIKVEFEFFFKSSSVTYLKNLISRDNAQDEFSIDSETVKDLQNMVKTRRGFISDTIFDNSISPFPELFRLNLLSILRYATKYSGFKSKLQDFMFVKLLCGFVKGRLDVLQLDNIKEILIGSSLYEYSSQEVLSEADALIISKRIHNVVSIIQDISDVITEYQRYIEVKDKDRFITYQAELVIDLMMLITKLPSNIVTNFHYGWKGFSTGEFAKLNLFAELYYYINDEKRSSLESHLIVMDEADLYLHPDWQREFLADTLGFLKAEFPKGSVQLVLTSHSPIIIGDFLPEDIISIYREENEPPKIGESFGFGTQILQLYMDGMHLSSTFGSHSKFHIDRIMKNKVNGCQTAFDKRLISKIKNSNIRRMLGVEE